MPSVTAITIHLTVRKRAMRALGIDLDVGRVEAPAESPGGSFACLGSGASVISTASIRAWPKSSGRNDSAISIVILPG